MYKQRFKRPRLLIFLLFFAWAINFSLIFSLKLDFNLLSQYIMPVGTIVWLIFVAYANKKRKFLKILKNIWAPLKYSTYMGYLNKWSLKNSLQVLNEDAFVFIFNLKSNIFFLISTLAIIVIIIFVTPRSLPLNTAQAIRDLDTVIFGLVALFLTISIFIAGNYLKNIDKNNEHSKDVLKLLKNNKQVFKNFYAENIKFLKEPYEKFSVIQAHAATSVYDQGSYDRFVSWLASLKLTDEATFYRYNKPYTICANAISNRESYVVSCLNLINNISGLHNDETESVNTEMLSNIYDYNDLGNYYEKYVPIEYMGYKLARVIRYGVWSLVVGFLYNFYSTLNIQYNFFENINLHTVDFITGFALFLTLMSILVAFKYVYGFIRYLGQDTQYSSYSTSVLPFRANSIDEIQEERFTPRYY